MSFRKFQKCCLELRGWSLDRPSSSPPSVSCVYGLALVCALVLRAGNKSSRGQRRPPRFQGARRQRRSLRGGGAELLGGSGSAVPAVSKMDGICTGSDVGVRDESGADGLKRSEGGWGPAGCGGSARSFMAASACVSRSAVSLAALARLNVLKVAPRWRPRGAVSNKRPDADRCFFFSFLGHAEIQCSSWKPSKDGVTFVKSSLHLRPYPASRCFVLGVEVCFHVKVNILFRSCEMCNFVPAQRDI